MASEIKVDTISEKTSANGVTIDGVSLKDSKIATANSVDSDAYVDGSIDAVHLSANSVDSDSYVDGSIDAVHLSANSVDSDAYVDGSIDAVHLSANSVDSDAYVDGSIDAVHLSANSVDSDAYVDGSIDLAHMSSESVDEDNLHISNAGSNDQFLQKQSGNTGGLTWATAGGGASQSSIWYIPATYAPSANDTIIVGWAESNAGGYNRLGTAPTESSDVFTMPATGWYWVSLFLSTIQLYTPTNDGISGAIHLSTDTGSSFDPVIFGHQRHTAGGSPTEETTTSTVAGIVKITNTTTDLIRLWVGGIGYAQTSVLGGSQDSTGNVGATTVSFTKLADI